MLKYARFSVFLLAGLFLLAALGIVIAGLQNDIQPSDLGVVLGSQVYPDGRPSAGLRARLDETAQLYRRGMFPHILVSGGIGTEGENEARAMAHYLTTQYKIPQQVILLDEHGDNTKATALNTARLLHIHQWNSVLIVSQYYHIPRSRLAFRKAGVPVIHYAHADYFGWRDFFSVPREAIAFPVYWLRSFPKPSAPTAATEPAGARAFMQQALRHGWEGYGGDSGSVAQETTALEQYFTHRLALALAIDNSDPNGVRVVDADPLCQCQDDAGLKEQIVSAIGDNRAAFVRVHYTANTDGAGKPWNNWAMFRLTPEKGGWKIADIRNRTGQWLLQRLEISNRTLLQKQKNVH